MTGALVIQMIGGAGFLAGIAAILHFLNTRSSTKSKGSSEAYQAYQAFVHGATDDRDREIARLVARANILFDTVDNLIDLVQDCVRALRARGASAAEVEHLQDRLDDQRRR